jgi:inositol oxygenase
MTGEAQIAADKENFRDYSADNDRFDRVSEFYRKSHTYQTVDFVKKQHEKYLKLDKKTMTLWQAFEMLEEIVDESDPDTDSAQIVHAYQTAEACRKRYPDEKYDWFHLAGFIHDLGKILAHPAFGGEPQWAVVGDTFPVGCAYSDKNVYPEYFAANPDYKHPVYSTEFGVYSPHCGLEHVTMSWGHDEYIYQVCIGNGSLLPDEALYVLRFHSFYPWHKGGAYKHLTTDKDERLLKWVQEFQKCDLYSKSDDPEDTPDPIKLRPYYQSLISKYFPKQTLKW